MRPTSAAVLPVPAPASTNSVSVRSVPDRGARAVVAASAGVNSESCAPCTTERLRSRRSSGAGHRAGHSTPVSATYSASSAAPTLRVHSRQRSAVPRWSGSQYSQSIQNRGPGAGRPRGKQPASMPSTIAAQRRVEGTPAHRRRRRSRPIVLAAPDEPVVRATTVSGDAPASARAASAYTGSCSLVPPANGSSSSNVASRLAGLVVEDEQPAVGGAVDAVDRATEPQ